MANETIDYQKKNSKGVDFNKLSVQIAIYGFLLALTILFMFPFYTMFVASFMERTALNSVTPNLWPNPFILDNYRALFTGEIGTSTIDSSYARAMLNSFLLATGQTIPALFFTSLVGFVFAKRRFPGRNALFVFVLLTMMLPYQSTIVPFFLLMSRLNWIDTFLPLWIPWWAPAFGIFLMRQFIMASVPDELMDAAAIDGTSLFGTYWRIVVPLITPVLAVFGILNFMSAWNDYIYSNIVIFSAEMRTLPLLLALYQGTSLRAPEYGIMAAGSVLAVIPLVIVFLFFQRRLISGIMSGALKG